MVFESTKSPPAEKQQIFNNIDAFQTTESIKHILRVGKIKIYAILPPFGNKYFVFKAS